MLAIYQMLISLAQERFADVVIQTQFIGGTPASPNKLRLLIIDGSFLGIWLSADGTIPITGNGERKVANSFAGITLLIIDR